jgi:Domain of unknown function DUF29
MVMSQEEQDAALLRVKDRVEAKRQSSLLENEMRRRAIADGEGAGDRLAQRDREEGGSGALGSEEEGEGRLRRDGAMRNYETDYAGWAEDTAEAIGQGRWSEIDRAALADEVLDLAKKERRAIRSRFEVLLLHLIKRQYQPMKASRSWDATLAEQRLRLARLYQENPSLRAEMKQAIEEAYALARLRAVRETGLTLETFPETLPFSETEIWGG